MIDYYTLNEAIVHTFSTLSTLTPILSILSENAPNCLITASMASSCFRFSFSCRLNYQLMIKTCYKSSNSIST